MFLHRSVILGSLLLASIATTVISSPLKFPDQRESADSGVQGRSLGSGGSVQGEGRFININKIPNGLFNRLTLTDKIHDDIEDYDDQVGGGSNEITERPDRRRHGHRRPCVPYKYRNNPSGNGRTFVNLFFNDYNIYGGGGGGGVSHDDVQYDTYGGYPCHSFGHRPHRPNRPSSGGGTLSDDTSNRPPFWGPGGIIDLNQILSNWLRPGSAGGGSGVLSDSAGGGSDPKPIVELNVQDSVQNAVQTAGGFLGAVQGLFSQTPALADAAPAAVQNDEPDKDPLIQPRPSKRPHKHHHSHHHHSHHHSHGDTQLDDVDQGEETPQIQSNRHRAYKWSSYNPEYQVTQIAGGISGSVNGYPINQVTGPQTFGANNRRYGSPQNSQGSSNSGSNNSNNDGFSAPWWSFFGLFN